MNNNNNNDLARSRVMCNHLGSSPIFTGHLKTLTNLDVSSRQVGLRNVEKQSLMAFVESQAGHVWEKCWSIFGRHLDLRSLRTTLQGTNISPKNGILKMIFLFPRWDMLIPWRVSLRTKSKCLFFFWGVFIPSLL